MQVPGIYGIRYKIASTFRYKKNGKGGKKQEERKREGEESCVETGDWLGDNKTWAF